MNSRRPDRAEATLLRLNDAQRALYLRNTGRATESYCRDLLRRAYASRGESLAEMTRLTRLAIAVAQSLPETRRAAGLLAEAHATQANALRIRGRIDQAGRELGSAWDSWRRSTRRPGVEAFLLEVQASLQESRRDLGGALRTLRRAVEVRRRCHSQRGLAKVLTQCGIVLAYSGRLEEATLVLVEALPLVRDVGGLRAVTGSLMWVLVELERPSDAACVLEQVAPAMESAGELERVRLGWARGRIMAGLKAADAARHLLGEAAAAYRERGLLLEEALVTLDLAKLACTEGSLGEVTYLASGLSTILMALGYSPESREAKSLAGIAAVEATTPALLRELVVALTLATGKKRLRHTGEGSHWDPNTPHLG